MLVPTDQAAAAVIGDTPSWAELLQHGQGHDRRVRAAAVDAAARAVDTPDEILDVLAEVCLVADGRATTWATRFHRLRASGHATRFAADVLQRACTDPVPYLVDLLVRDHGDLAARCHDHPSAAVRAAAGAVAERVTSG